MLMAMRQRALDESRQRKTGGSAGTEKEGDGCNEKK